MGAKVGSSRSAVQEMQAPAEVWAEMLRYLGLEQVSQLLRSPRVLRAELVVARERLRREAAVGCRTRP